jgi:hypothetical protein
MSQIHMSVDAAQTAILNGQNALSTIFNPDGSLNWNIFLGGVDFTAMSATTQTCLTNAFPTNNIALLVLTAPQDIATALKCILDDVATTAGIANTDLNTAITLLNQALAMTVPGSPDAIAIQAMLTEITPLKADYDTTMQLLASQLTIVTGFLGTLSSLAEGAVPVPILNIFVGMTVSSFVQPIVTEILHFQAQLEAL